MNSCCTIFWKKIRNINRFDRVSSETLFAKNVLSLKQRSLLAPGPRKQGCLHVTLAVASKTFITQRQKPIMKSLDIPILIKQKYHHHNHWPPPPPPPATSGIAISGLRFLALHLWWCNDLLNEATATTTGETGEGSGNDGRTRLPSHGDYQNGKVSTVNLGVYISKVPVLQKKTKSSTKKCTKSISSYLVTFFSSPFLVSLISSRSQMQENISRLTLICLPTLQNQKWKAENQDLRYPIPRKKKPTSSKWLANFGRSPWFFMV